MSGAESMVHHRIRYDKLRSARIVRDDSIAMIDLDVY